MKRLLTLVVTLCLLTAVSAEAPAQLAPSITSSLAISEEQAPHWVIIHAYTPAEVSRLAHLHLDAVSSGLSEGYHVLATQAQLNAVTSLGYTYEHVDYDLEAAFNQWGSWVGTEFLGGYRTFADAEIELHQLATDNPHIFHLESYGKSYENRDIWVMKVSEDPLVDDETKVRMFLHGVCHAREIMTLEIPMYFLNMIADNYGVDPDLTEWINQHELYIMPIQNPDGHVYVENNHSGNPHNWWRKNRSPQAYGYRGVDLNRNYGHMWGYDNQGSSNWPGDITYRGTAPFSEAESQAVHDLYMAKPGIEFAISYHSYGQYIIYPWGYNNEPTEHEELYVDQAQQMMLVIFQNSGKIYQTGRCGDLLYPVNGDFTDWSYGGDTFTGGTYPGGAISYTFEVNNLSEGGFAPDSSYIEPTCELMWEVFLWMLEHAVEKSSVNLADLEVVAVGDGVRLSFRDSGSEGGTFWVQRNIGGHWLDLNERPLVISDSNSWLDLDVEPSTLYTYRVRTLSDGGETDYFGPVEITTPPAVYRAELARPFPSPLSAGAAATIEFSLPETGSLSLVVYDVSGRRVATLAEGAFSAGRHSLEWSTDGAAPGVYLINLQTGAENLTRRLAITR